MLLDSKPVLAALLGALAICSAPATPAGQPDAATPALPDTRAVPEWRRPSPLPADWRQGPFMEIFVRGYADSDGDGIGDLRGLTSKLDYLQALGVRGLWLMPITASADRDHGYATTDHRAIEPQYGTLADFDALIREAHRRGIGVVMDYVINHSASEHALFKAARADRHSRWRDWFVWSEAPLAQLQDWRIFDQLPWYESGQGDGARYFATFGASMPDFNMRHPAVVAYHADSLRFWLNRGLDGFRLDAVPHLIENNARDWNDQPESRALTARYVREIHRYPQRYVVCEATAEPRRYSQPDLCGSAFAFGLERAILRAAQGEAVAVPQVAAFFQNAPLSMATMLSNHDIFAGQRPWDQLQGDERRYRLAAASYLLLPGTPFIYYGEEIGQGGVTQLPGDEPLRAPMSWTPQGGFSSAAQPFRPTAPNVAQHNVQSQSADPGSLLNFYKALLALRRSQPALAGGSYEDAQVEGQVLAFQRQWRHQRVLVVINYGLQTQTLAASGLGPQHRLQPLYADPTRPADAPPPQAQALVLPPQSVQVFGIHPQAPSPRSRPATLR